MAVGSLCLVLHAHVPYVLRHGIWPHGEDWLYEAAAETYLPLLALIDDCYDLGAKPLFTISLTPVLLEQLAHEEFKKGFERYLQDRLDRARQDRQDQMDAESLCNVLQTQIVPGFCDRDADGIPRRWVAYQKRCLRTLAWRFSAYRMLVDYAFGFYLPAA